MAEKQSLLQVATHYHEMAQNLVKHKDSLSPEQVLECLVTRDWVAHLLNKEGPAEPTAANLIDQGDHQLRAVAVPISQMKELKEWQQSFSPSVKAWWWRFTPPSSTPGFFERWDWLWTALALTCLTISFSLVADISPRFLSGGPDTWGAFIVIAQSVLALLTTSSVLTSAGREAAKRILSSLKMMPERFWDEVGFIVAVLLLSTLIIFRLSLPQIARWYNDSGVENYMVTCLNSAQLKPQFLLQAML